MKAHATGTQWFPFNPMMVLALAAGILLAVAALTINDVVDLPFTSESRTVTTSSFQNPVEHTRFLEQNLYLPSGGLAEPALSVDRMIFLEQNIWDYSTLPDTDQGAAPPAVPPVSYPADQLD